MDYRGDQGGRVADDASGGGRDDAPTFAGVEERLIEALLLWRRAPDREASWQHVRSLWPDIGRHGWRVDVDGEFDEREAAPEPKRPGLTRDEVAEMNRVAEWMRFVPERDRRLVVLALGQKAGGRENVDWARVRRRLDAEIGRKGLYRRYCRAIAGVVRELDAGHIALSR